MSGGRRADGRESLTNRDFDGQEDGREPTSGRSWKRTWSLTLLGTWLPYSFFFDPRRPEAALVVPPRWQPSATPPGVWSPRERHDEVTR